MGIRPIARENLAARTRAVLREAIRAGEWTERLPGEHRLCAELGVSRPVLRAALASLEEEGLLRTVKGSQRLILKPKRGKRVAGSPRRVGVLGYTDLSSPYLMSLYEAVQKYLHSQGYEVEFYSDRRIEAARPELFLERLVGQERCGAWLLFSVSSAVQRWFETSGRPTLIVGYCHRGIALPALDTDHAAISQHAAHQLKTKGHRQAALIRSQDRAGDLISEEVFRREFEKGGGQVRLLRVEGDDYERVVERLLKLRPQPTALFVCCAEEAFALTSRLLNRGVSIPETYSIICRDSHELMNFLAPDLTRYGKEVAREGRKLTSLLNRLLFDKKLAPKQYTIMPDFHPGATLRAFNQSFDLPEPADSRRR